MPMSLTALREIFREVSPSRLPPDLAACLADNKNVVEANHAAYRQWEHQRNEGRVASNFTDSAAYPATLDLLLLPADLAQSQGPTPPPHLPMSSAAAKLPQTIPSTVPGTDQHEPRDKSADPDLALQLCPNTVPTATRDENRNNWDPLVLFPELSTSVSQTAHPPLIASTLPNKSPISTSKAIPPQQPRRMARIKTNNKAGKSAMLVTPQTEDFYDIPLQYMEGREILSLIGASQVPIPAHLMAPQQSLPLLNETGQSSKAKPKRKKMEGLPARSTDAPQPSRPPTTRAQSAPLVPKARQPLTVRTRRSSPPQQPPLGPSPDTTAQQENSQSQSPTDTDTKDTADPTIVKDAIEGDDPYLDRVDYSGDDDLNV